MVNLQGFLIQHQDKGDLNNDDIVAVYPEQGIGKEDDVEPIFSDSAAFPISGAYPGTPARKTSDGEDFSENQVKKMENNQIF